MKKLLCAVIMTGVLLTGCGNDTKQEMTDTANAVTLQSVNDIYTTVSALTDSTLVELDDKMIKNYFGIDAADLDDYVFAQSEDPTSAEMIIIAKASADTDISKYETNIENILEQKKSEMTNYNEPEQAKLVEDAEKDFESNTMYVVVAAKADTIAETIENGLGL